MNKIKSQIDCLYGATTFGASSKTFNLKRF